VEDKSLKMALDVFGEIRDIQSEISKCISLSGFQWSTCVKRVGSRPATTASFVEAGVIRPISNTTTILDKATDMAAPENMKAETLQVPDNAPTPQKDEIGQRAVEAAPAMEEERVLEPTMAQRANDHRWRGGDGRSVTIMSHRPGRGWRTGWRHLKSSNQ